MTLHYMHKQMMHAVSAGMQFVVLYLRVKDGGVGEGVVGEDVSPVVDLLQSQVYCWDGS